MIINQVRADTLAQLTRLTDQVVRCALDLSVTVSLFKAAVFKPATPDESIGHLRTEIVGKSDNMILAAGELDRHFHDTQRVLGLIEPDDELH